LKVFFNDGLFDGCMFWRLKIWLYINLFKIYWSWKSQRNFVYCELLKKITTACYYCDKKIYANVLLTTIYIKKKIYSNFYILLKKIKLFFFHSAIIICLFIFNFISLNKHPLKHHYMNEVTKILNIIVTTTKFEVSYEI
jgi:hypothetical protein